MAVYRSSIRDARDYSGPLLGFEIEAYAVAAVTGDDGGGEDDASDRTLRRVAKHLRRTTRLPFKPIIENRFGAKQAKTREPNSSLENPIWGVTGDRSLEPVRFRRGYITGIELVTPPLSPRLSLQCLAMIHSGMFPRAGRKEFFSDLFAGLHINVSLPSLSRKTAGIALLNPYFSFVPPDRRRRFADTLFTAVVGILSRCAYSPEEAMDAFLDLAALERGWHPTNPEPLLRGRGYLEFRHLGSMVFQKRLEAVEDLCWRLIRLLSDPPMADVRRRAEQALGIAQRVRSLDTNNKLGKALSNITQTENGRFELDASHLVNCGVFNAVYDICLSDRALSKAFPWIGIYDAYRKNPTVNDIQKRGKIPPQTRYFRSWDREPRVCLSGQESHAHPV